VTKETTDLCIVGGGYTGLWTAIIAKERDPGRGVVLLEASTIGSGASGRNGGFMESSLTHGVANGQQRFPDELGVLESLGLANLDAIEQAIKHYGIDCDYERTGVIDVATQPHHLTELTDDYRQLAALGQDVVLLDREQMLAEVASPTYVGGLWRKDRAALVDPARLAWGLKAAALDHGVQIYEHTPVRSIERDGPAVEARTPFGSIRAGRLALATNAFPPLLRRIRRYIVPVYDYALVTEPLTPEQLAAIGWDKRQGLSDQTNQFHYYRLTEDSRILWGGFDAIYYFGGKMDPKLEQRPETWARLSQHFFETFPQLAGIQFTHAWGGAIDTCTRFCVFWDVAMRGKVAWALGYTGLGVASTRFGAEVMLDLLDGRLTRPTELEFVRRRPLPFPPEPIRFAGIQLTRWSLDYADHHDGHWNIWLRTLDRLGLGFDS
jgi:glycine/D-amino acid oxidase-like deaminating enzyme